MSVESRLELDEKEYLDMFTPYMMDVVESWCNQASFAEIVQQHPEIYEGMWCCWLVWVIGCDCPSR